MIVSDSRGFIAFQPWKCASTTLYSRLGKYDSGRYPQGRYHNTFLDKTVSKHIGLDDFMWLPESSEDYFRFCFVRNPYDRIRAGFFQRRWRFEKEDAAFAAENAAEHRSISRGFSSFLRYCVSQRVAGTSPPGGFLDVHVLHAGEPALDFVGYVETFEDDFHDVCEELSIADPGDRNANVRFKDSTKPFQRGTEPQYRYLEDFDPESVALVNEAYADDFGLLGYTMIDPSAFDSGAPPDVFATRRNRGPGLTRDRSAS